MTGELLGFILFAVLVPLLVSEAGDLAPSLARWLLRWGARHIGEPDYAQRYEEEWLADLDRVPGKITKLGHACGVVVLGVPRLRAQFRQRPRGALLSGWIAGRAARQLTGAAETDAALQRAAEMLVPRFADHCFIDLFQGIALIRRVQRNADGWTPPPGTWAKPGEQIRYPEGHFCQQAMAHLDTVIIPDLTHDSLPAPSPQSLAASDQVGLKSVLVAPLLARGELLGLISVATSGLTGRSQHFGPGDRNFIGTVASQLSAAIDTATTPGIGQSARKQARPQSESVQRPSSLATPQT